MEEVSANLRCLLVALQGGQVLLPNSFVLEVLPFATPLRIEGRRTGWSAPCCGEI